jgi:hypothetical protein
LIAALITSAVAFSDDWPSPVTREVFSPSRSHFVRVIPGSNWSESVGFKGASKGLPAQAEYFVRRADASYRRSAVVSLANPVAPVDLFVSDQGYLATLDNWHNMGYGKVAVFYRPDGQVIRAYELSELFSAAEIGRFSTSVSSIQWRSQTAYLNPDGRSLYVNIAAGVDLVFDMQSGAHQFCMTADGLYSCRQSPGDRGGWPYRSF